MIKRGKTHTGRSGLWRLMPVVVAWLATTWTPYDLPLMMLAALTFLWVTFTGRNGPVAGIRGAWRVVLVAGAFAIAHDVLVSRLAVIDTFSARTVQIGGVFVLFLAWSLIRAGAHRSAIAAVLLFSLISGLVFIGRVAQPPIEIWRAHEGAAHLLVTGGNPYSDLNLISEPGSATGPLWQYFYPPVTLAWYSMWTIFLGDPRWASLVAWITILATGSIAAMRSFDRSLSTAILAFAAVQPGWFFLLAGSFTEPLIAMFVSLSLATTTKLPRLGAVILGLALAAKQHMLLALPVAVMDFWHWARQNAMILAVAALVGVATGLAFGSVDFVSAIMAPSAARPNADGVNLYALGSVFGLDLIASSWLAAVVASLVGILLSWRNSSASRLLDHMSVVVSTFLFLVPYAIWSHWMIVTMLLTISMFLESCWPPTLSNRDRRLPRLSS